MQINKFTLGIALLAATSVSLSFPSGPPAEKPFASAYAAEIRQGLVYNLIAADSLRKVSTIKEGADQGACFA